MKNNDTLKVGDTVKFSDGDYIITNHVYYAGDEYCHRARMIDDNIDIHGEWMKIEKDGFYPVEDEELVKNLYSYDSVHKVIKTDALNKNIENSLIDAKVDFFKYLSATMVSLAGVTLSGALNSVPGVVVSSVATAASVYACARTFNDMDKEIKEDTKRFTK